ADPAYTSLLGFLAAEGIAWRPARPGMEFALDGVRFRVLHPDTTWSEWGADVNEGSAVVRVDYGQFSALFAGDAGFSAEARMAGTVGAVDLLKVGHHGSRGSTGEAWLRELSPRAAVISMRRNTYGHPAPDLLRRPEAHCIAIWRTTLATAVSAQHHGRSRQVEGH